jgi:hypothetical protein
MRQKSIHTKRDERLSWATREECLGFIRGLLDNGAERRVYCGLHISDRYGLSSELEAAMKQDEKTGKVTTTIQEMAYYNMFLAEAIFELLAEKGILTGEEVLERVKKLKIESPVQFRWMQ